MSDAFSVRDPRGRIFWIAYLCIAIVAIFLGFKADVTARFSDTAEYPANPALVLHVWTMGAWMVLLMLQLALSITKKMTWHKTIGLSALILVPVAVVSGFWAEIIAERFWEQRYPDYVTFLHVPIAQMGGFGIFAGLALVWRKRPEFHRRMMYLTASSVIAAAWGRSWRDNIVLPLLDGSPAFFVEFFGWHFGFIVMTVAAAVFDWRTRGSVHPALAWGGGAMIGAMAILVALTLTDWWPDFGRALIGL